MVVIWFKANGQSHFTCWCVASIFTSSIYIHLAAESFRFTFFFVLVFEASQIFHWTTLTKHAALFFQENCIANATWSCPFDMLFFFMKYIIFVLYISNKLNEEKKTNMQWKSTSIHSYSLNRVMLVLWNPMNEKQIQDLVRTLFEINRKL